MRCFTAKKDMSSIFVRNEMTGEYVRIEDFIAEAYNRWAVLYNAWLVYARHLHDNTDVASADVLDGLARRSDEAWRDFSPYAGLWILATKGISLN